VSKFEEILAICKTRYLIGGLRSFGEIPCTTVDFAWSHSVLEHVLKRELDLTLHELFRVMKQGAYTSHNIDYQDHLAGALNNLRFSEQLWESPLFADSGFYTNRIPAVTMHEIFTQVGFDLLNEQFGSWQTMPTSRKAFSEDFAHYSDHDLINRTSYLLAQKKIDDYDDLYKV
jgi:hypothetical protein